MIATQSAAVRKNPRTNNPDGVLQRFELLKGLHYEPDPAWTPNPALDFSANYKDPDRLCKFSVAEGNVIVEARRDLCAEFPNKFRPVIEQAQGFELTEERVKLVDEMIASGRWKEATDRAFLQQLPEATFQRIRQREQEQAQSLANAGNIATQQQSSTKVNSPLGQDITDAFQRAYDEGFRVFVNATGKHSVTKRDNPNTALNRKPLTKDEVEGFVGQWLKDNTK
jgi:hypothetical protein